MTARLHLKHLRALLFCLAALAPVTRAQAQSTIREISPERVRQDLREGETVRLVGKYMGLVHQELQLFDIPFPFDLSGDPSLARALLNFQPGRDNLTVEGRLRRDPTSGKRTFVVSRISGGSSDSELFKSRLEVLSKDQRVTSEEVLALAVKIFRIESRFADAELKQVLSQTIYHAYKLGVIALDARSADAQLQVLEGIFRKVPVEEVFGKLLADLDSRYPGHPLIGARLRKLGFREHLGKWLSHAEFKRSEGFIWNGEEWVKALENEFYVVLDVLSTANLTNLILRSRTDREFRQLARVGQLHTGMTRQEAAQAAEFPDRVRRRKFGDQEIDQWDYGDRRIYFLNGSVLLVWEPGKHAEGLAAIPKLLGTVLEGQMDLPGRQKPKAKPKK